MLHEANWCRVVSQLDSSESVRATLRRAQADADALCQPGRMWASLVHLQRLTAVPTSAQLFQSLVVVFDDSIEAAVQGEWGASPSSSSSRRDDTCVVSRWKSVERTNFQVTLFVAPEADVRATLVYDRSSCSHASAERVVDSLRSLLVRLSELYHVDGATLADAMAKSVPSAGDRAILRQVNSGVGVAPQSAAGTGDDPLAAPLLHEMFVRRAQLSPHRTAIDLVPLLFGATAPPLSPLKSPTRQGAGTPAAVTASADVPVEAMSIEGAFTYACLDQRTNQIASVLRMCGVARASPVVVLCPRNAHLVPALVAVLKAGGYYVPVDTYFPVDRIRGILSQLDAKVLLTHVSCVRLVQRVLGLGWSSHDAVVGAGRQEACPAGVGRCFERGNVRVDVAIMLGADTWGCINSRFRVSTNAGSADDTSSERGGDERSVAFISELVVRRQPVSPLPRLGVQPSDIAYIIFTSGSTGQPKGVVVSHASAVNLVRWIAGSFDMRPADRVLAVASVAFDLSVYDVFGTLATGGAIMVVPQPHIRNPEALIDAITLRGATVWNSAPAVLTQLAVRCGSAGVRAEIRRVAGPTTMRVVMLSGDWIPLDTVAAMAITFGRAAMWSLGGATEATVWSNAYHVVSIDDQWRSIPYGRPMVGCDYYVLDEDLRPCPVGVVGFLYIAGPCVTLGYLGSPRLTASKYVPIPGYLAEVGHAFAPGARMYWTGDCARVMEDGQLEFCGRLDRQVKLRGFRVELGEIEGVLHQVPGVRQALAVVSSLTSSPGAASQQLVAFVSRSVDDVGARITSEGVLAAIATQLPPYMIPSVLVVRDAFPMTNVGKVDSKALLAELRESQGVSEAGTGASHEAGTASTGTTAATPQDELERVIHRGWCTVLGINGCSCEANFFELGGDSLVVLRLLGVLNASSNGLPSLTAAQCSVVGASDDAPLGLKATPAALFQFPTVSSLAAHLRELVASGDACADVETLESVTAPTDVMARLEARLQTLLDTNAGSGATRSGESLETAYRLTGCQMGMLVDTLAAPEAGLYHNQWVFTVSASPRFRANVWRACWDACVCREPAFRTSFAWDAGSDDRETAARGRSVSITSNSGTSRRRSSSVGSEHTRERPSHFGGWYQCVRRQGWLPWEPLCDDALPGGSMFTPGGEALLAMVRDWTRVNRTEQPMPVAPEPDTLDCSLVRMSCAATRGGDWVYVFGGHHLVIDGWTFSLLFRRVCRLYAACCGEISDQDVAAVFALAGSPALASATVAKLLQPYLEAVDAAEVGPQASMEHVVAFQATALSSADVLRRARAYWGMLLKGVAAPTPVPMLASHHAAASSVPRVSSLDEVSWTFTAQQAAEWRRLLSQSPYTPALLVQAAWALVLARWAGIEDVVFGVVVSGRVAPLPGLDRMVGCAVNLIPVRACPSSNKGVQEWLQDMRTQSVASLEHVGTPLHLVQSWCDDMSAGERLFNTIVVMDTPDDALHGAAAGLAEASGVSISGVDFRSATSYPLTLYWRSTPTEHLPSAGTAVPRLCCSFSEDLLPRAGVQALAESVAHVVLQLAAASTLSQPSTQLRDIGMLSPRQQSAIVANCSGAAQFSPPLAAIARHASVLSMFREAAEAHPLDVAVATVADAESVAAHAGVAHSLGATQVTYSRLLKLVCALASTLVRMGVNVGDAVGLGAEKGVWYVAGFLGIMQAGCVVVPLNATFPAGRLTEVLTDTHASVVVASPRVTQLLRAGGVVDGTDDATPVCVDMAVAWAASESDLSLMLPTAELHRLAQASAGGAAYVLHTSGSTGKPKGVLVSAKALAANVVGQVERLQYTRGTRAFHFSAPSFDVSVGELFCPLVVGGCLVMEPVLANVAESTHSLQHVFRDLAVTLAVGTASFLGAFKINRQEGVRVPESPLPQLQTVASVGEGLPRAVVEQWLRVSKRVVNVYGPTEATISASTLTVERPPLDSAHRVGVVAAQPGVLARVCGSQPYVPIGVPQPRYRCMVLDPTTLELLPPYMPGELFIGGDGVAMGLLHLPAPTAAVFMPDPFSDTPGARMYSTGDAAMLVGGSTPDEWFVSILGRKDNQVKLRGHRVELDEVQHCLLSCPGVSQAAVVLRRSAGNGAPQLVAFCRVEDEVDGQLPAASQPEVAPADGEIQAVREAGWGQVFDEIYQSRDVGTPAHNNYAGWLDSAARQPIPDAQMDVQFTATVSRIRNVCLPSSLTRPRVLELGCGLGLVALRLLPFCCTYAACDLSPTALEVLGSAAQQPPPSGAQAAVHTCTHQPLTADDVASLLARQPVGTAPCVQLAVAGARQFVSLACEIVSRTPAVAFDAVVINSVLQYFPSTEYALAVLQAAVKCVAHRHGRVFVGDVRAAGMLGPFHFEQLGRHASVDRVAAAVRHDKELAVSAAAWAVLVPQLCLDVVAVDVMLKRGRDHNEITLYRYDVVLHTALDETPSVQSSTPPTLRAQQWSDVCPASHTSTAALACLEALASHVKSTGDAVVVVDVPDGRTAPVVNGYSVLHGKSPPSGPAIHPEDVWHACGQHGIATMIMPPRSRAVGTFDVLLQPLQRHQRRRVHSSTWYCMEHGSSPRVPIAKLESAWSEMCHAPYHAVTSTTRPASSASSRQRRSQLLQHVVSRLPAFMVPDEIVPMAKLPATPSGKVDRQALLRLAAGSGIAASPHGVDATDATVEVSAEQHAVWCVWQEVLCVGDDVSTVVRPSLTFYEAGGDSLSLFTLLAKLNARFDVSLSPAVLFRAMSLEDQAAAIQAARQHPTPAKAHAGSATLHSVGPTSSDASVYATVLAPHAAATSDSYAQALSRVAHAGRVTRAVVPSQPNARVRIDGAALFYVPSRVAALAGLDAASPSSLSDAWGESPQLVCTVDTPAGRIGYIALPITDAALLSDKSRLLRLVHEAVLVAALHGAKVAALTGVLPAVTRYGLDVTRAASGTAPARSQSTTVSQAAASVHVTTGHGATSSAMVLSVLGLLHAAGRATREGVGMRHENVAVVGLGGVGLSTLRLLLRAVEHPASFTLCEVAAKADDVARIVEEMRSVFGYRGDVHVAISSGPQVSPHAHPMHLASPRILYRSHPYRAACLVYTRSLRTSMSAR